MANAYILNQKPMGYGNAMSLIVEMLVAAGWTYQGSGTGASVASSVSFNLNTPSTIILSSITSNNWQIGAGLTFTTSGTLPAPLTVGTIYYIIQQGFSGATGTGGGGADTSSFQISATPNGSPISITTAGSGTQTATEPSTFAVSSVNSSVTISNASPGVVTWNAHGLLATNPVIFTTTGALPTGLTAGTTYYVVSPATNTFNVALVPGGAAINTSSAGSGTHTATSSSRVFFPAGGTNSGGWANVNAWARIQDPGGGREFVFQHDNNAGALIKYSPSAKFIGAANGAVSATVVPTATDERFLWGSTGSLPSWFPTAMKTGALIFQGAALAAAPYGFWFAAQWISHPGFRAVGMMLDPVTSVPEDTDPCVIHMGGRDGSSGLHTAFVVNSSNVGRVGSTLSTWTLPNGNTGGAQTVSGCWAFMDVARTAFLYVQPMGYACNFTGNTLRVVNGVVNVSGGATFNSTILGTNPFNNKPEAFPVAYGRIQVPFSATVPTQIFMSGLKGWSTMARWTTTNMVSFVDTLDNKNWICVGPFWLPWDGTTTPTY